jgi:hypothetical protein
MARPGNRFRLPAPLPKGGSGGFCNWTGQGGSKKKGKRKKKEKRKKKKEKAK